MTEDDFPEDFTPIAAELQRLPYMAPSRHFADQVISRVAKLNPGAQHELLPAARPHLGLERGGKAGIATRRRSPLVRTALATSTGVVLVAAAALMFVEIDFITALLAAAASQYAFVVAAVATQAAGAVLGSTTMTYLQAGAAEAALVYLTLALGLASGYFGIRAAASIAKKRGA